MWRQVALAVVLGVSLTSGFWFGGTLERGVSVATMVIAAVCVILGDLLGAPDSRGSRIATAVAAGLLFAAGWYLAGLEIDGAFTECSQQGEDVRRELEVHHRDNGGYPEQLDELRHVRIPGQRMLRPGLLEYHRTGEGYVLSYRDTFVEITATQDRGFFE